MNCPARSVRNSPQMGSHAPRRISILLRFYFRRFKTLWQKHEGRCCPAPAFPSAFPYINRLYALSIHKVFFNVNLYFYIYLNICVALVTAQPEQLLAWKRILKSNSIFYPFTFTVSTAFFPFCVRTVILAVPFFLAFTFPPSVTVATDFLEDLKVTFEV